tara:strand:- start:1216 stop:2802 length:1587 start_codon:yes stop_codon:yes gene_type:complete
MANLIVSAVMKWNGSALKKAGKDLTAFQKTTNLLAKSFAVAFAARKITQFGKAAVQAFAADEKAAKSLAVALKNTGNGFATIATEGFIARLQDTYKVLDDELRPAFQSLLTATGSITKAQAGLQLALDVSAGTTRDLQSVTAALSRGYAGNTQGLSRLGAGLDKAILKTGDMEQITGALSARFSGQALAATTTYTGQMNALAVASANAKEEIGKGLLDSIALLGGTDGIHTATNNMEGLGKAIGDATFGLATLVRTFNDSPFGKVIGKGFELGNIPKLLADFGGSQRGSTVGKGMAYSPTSMYFTVEQAERAKLVNTIKKQNTTEKEKQKLSAAELAAKKKEAELDALKKKFDVDRINLETALANSKDEAEKARIRSLLTIMDEDANGAAKRMAELDTANINEMKAKLAAAASLAYLADEAKRAALGLASIGNPSGNYAYTPSAPSFVYGAGSVPDLPGGMSNMPAGNPEGIYDYTPSNPSFTYSPPVVNNIVINTPLGSEEVLTEAMQRALQKLNRYGDSTTFAGAL